MKKLLAPMFVFAALMVGCAEKAAPPAEEKAAAPATETPPAETPPAEDATEAP